MLQKLVADELEVALLSVVKNEECFIQLTGRSLRSCTKIQSMITQYPFIVEAIRALLSDDKNIVTLKAA